jgi:hypothetical protein
MLVAVSIFFTVLEDTDVVDAGDIVGDTDPVVDAGDIVGDIDAVVDAGDIVGDIDAVVDIFVYAAVVGIGAGGDC